LRCTLGERLFAMALPRAMRRGSLSAWCRRRDRAPPGARAWPVPQSRRSSLCPWVCRWSLVRSGIAAPVLQRYHTGRC